MLAYVVIGILAFAMGVVVTLFFHKLGQWKKHKE